MIEHCCKALKKKNEEIFTNIKISKENKKWWYEEDGGEEFYSEDGIKFCPFCGKELRKVKKK